MIRRNLVNDPHQSGQRKISLRGTIALMTVKLLFDIAVLLLGAVALWRKRAMIKKTPAPITDKISLAGTPFDVAINLCFRFSMTCIVFLEVRLCSDCNLY